MVIAMAMRKSVVIPALVATFAVGWAYKGGFTAGIVGGVSAIYNANIVAATELFGIILLISFMVSMLNALRKVGADHALVTPIQKLMINGHVAYWVLFGATAIISTAFWPTPAVPLVAAILMPAALRAGLPPMGVAIAVTLSGQGMALASDALMRVAPAISAGAMGNQGLTEAIWAKGIVLTLVVGAVASVWSYMQIAKSIKRPEEVGDVALGQVAAAAAPMKGAQDSALAKPMAYTTILAFVLVVVAMIVLDLKGGDAGALVGGTAAAIMLITSIIAHGKDAFDEVADRLTEGFGFAIKIMGSIIPIAAFFFLGAASNSAKVLGENAPGFLFDMVTAIQSYIPQNEFIAAFGVLAVGLLAGFDGSGFSGLPITGALSGALAQGTAVDPTMLAAVGQMGNIWTGGGTIIAWSSLVAVAGFAGVSAVDLARRNFVPVIVGLILATIVAVILW
ncbi:MAG: hypothetical protein ACOY94_14385 [Bacillota bacterium]